jgi:hypothetical protein
MLLGGSTVLAFVGYCVVYTVAGFILGEVLDQYLKRGK